MTIVPENRGTDQPVTRILKRLCCSLSPVRALRRLRISSRHSRKGTDTSSPGCGRRVLQTSIEALDVAFSVAGTIPVVGQPLKGALEALCKVLKGIEQRFQNSEAATKLVERLVTLGDSLSAVQAPDALLLLLVRRLDTIKNDLESLLYRPGIRYSAVAQALADFTGQIDSCQIDYLTVTQIELVNRTRVVDVESINTQCVRVIDPFGAPQSILRMDIGNIEVVAFTILRRYDFNPFLKTALDDFVSRGLYELTMDDGHRIERLTLSAVGKGAMVVMSVVVVEAIAHPDDHRCPMCKGRMSVQDEGREICAACDRRVSAVKSSDLIGQAGENVQRPPAAYALFRHITVSHTNSPRIEELESTHEESDVVEDLDSNEDTDAGKGINVDDDPNEDTHHEEDTHSNGDTNADNDTHHNGNIRRDDDPDPAENPSPRTISAQTFQPKKQAFNAEYTQVLKQYFEHNAYPSARDRELLARKSSMFPRQIEVWFQNHRRRALREGRSLKHISTYPLPPISL
ncbi:hypothetical protein FA13DRAFT_1690822 [Coprinellus micaceus]|uniref:Homeobox domain-containing protein n=1 Tax=Coprinellus micaceus TaxID=71717 RepID=A0A4Y7T2F9_COPMI|nr:hypothetical protein FA13DRAFT_1690822 [Coprinellus micaceus]